MLAERDFDYIRDLVRDRAAIVLEPGKEYLAVTRLDPVIRRAGLGSVSELVATLREDDDQGLSEQVVDALTTNETTFFRDVYPFESLRTHVLPDLIERKRLSRSLFIWSAGCSSGQEPYSVAMLIREDFPELAGWQVTILGTDVSVAMLERARAGRYGQIEVNRGLPADLLVRYFRRDGLGWELDESVREMVRFQHQNLMDPWPSLPPMDLVLMRNVMIYFDVTSKQEILTRVHDVLAPHGYLLLGTSETTLHLDDSFRRHAVGPTGWYRRKRGTPVGAVEPRMGPMIGPKMGQPEGGTTWSSARTTSVRS
jgi:chemotaxis protein methyltransferase CheR